MLKEDICPGCGEEYQALGGHWKGSPEHRPSLTDEQKEIITGLVMGDASIDRTSKNPKVVMQMITKEYLDWMHEKFGVLSASVNFYSSAENQARKNRETGFSENAKAENYSDVYQWRSRTHPELQEFADWYSSGKKVFPDDVELTPTVLKHWYVCDGYRENSGNRLVISISNESEETDKIDEMFENVGLPTPQYDYIERKGNSTKCNARWRTEESKELIDYMGEPLPGFEYKWGE